MDLELWFDHGLGDCVHFAHLAQLYRKRGYRLRLVTEPNKRFVWQVAGVANAPGGAPHVVWGYPSGWSDLSAPDLLAGKVQHNINHPPLPNIGNREELWPELCQVRLTALPWIPPEAMRDAYKFIAQLPRPVVLLHDKGNTSADKKDLPEGVSLDLQRRLAENGYGVVVLDWDRRAPVFEHPNVLGAHVRWAVMPLEVLAALVELSDLLIAIDSGPYHFALFSSIPVVGVWRRHFPSRCGLPNPRAVNLIGDQPHWDSEDRDAWNLRRCEGQEPTSTEIFDVAVGILSAAGKSRPPVTSEWQLASPEDQADLPGRYVYERVGHDHRAMTLLPDGIIGDGAAGRERRWALCVSGDVLRLSILGEDGFPTCHLERDPAGVWCGQWLYWERMPITLQRTRQLQPIELATIDRTEFRTELMRSIHPTDGESFADWMPRYELLHRVVATFRPRRICEIGVRAGYSALTMLLASPGAFLLGIDADTDHTRFDSHCGIRGIWQHSLKITTGHNFHLLLVDSHAIQQLPRFDLVYIDGDHTTTGCLSDLRLAAKSTDLILCDDYAVTNLGVRAACDQFVREYAWQGEFFDNGSTGLYVMRRCV